MAALNLRATTDADRDFVVEAESDPDNRPFIMPWSRHQHAAALRDPDIEHRVAEDDGRNLVGFVIPAGLTNADSCVEFRRIVVVSIVVLSASSP